MHITIGIYNALRKYIEKENKARKEAEEKAQRNQSAQTPSFKMPSGMPHI